MVRPLNNIGQMTNLHSKHRIIDMSVYIKLFLDKLACSFEVWASLKKKRKSSTPKEY